MRFTKEKLKENGILNLFMESIIKFNSHMWSQKWGRIELAEII